MTRQRRSVQAADNQTNSDVPKKDRLLKNIGGYWEGEYGDNISIDDYNGDLIFYPKADPNKAYKVKRVYLYEPKRTNNPKNLVYDLVIDLKNANSTEEENNN